MPSKEFQNLMSSIPSEPPKMDPALMNAIPEEYRQIGVPVMPPNFKPPFPKIPDGYLGDSVVYGGVEGFHMTKSGAMEYCAFMHIHGGGFTIGSAYDAPWLLKLFLDETNLEGFSVNYTLAPYAKFPTAVNECLAFYKGLLEAGYKRIIIGGESAGAGLSLSVTHAIREAGLPQPIAVWCSSPVGEIDYSKKEISKYDMFAEGCDALMDAYCPNADTSNPLLSPVEGDFTDFPPLFIQCGSEESLSYSAIRVAMKAAKAGNEVEFHMGKGMPHTFAMDYGKYPEATYAMNEIVAFVKQALELTS